jgi:hypothetical protein
MVGDPMQALIGSLPSVLGLASGVILFLIALVQGLMRAPDLITPTNYQTEQTAAHPVRVGEFEPDLAWPFYPFRQARADLARVGADLGGRYGKLAKWPLDAFFRGRHGSRFWWWPHGSCRPSASTTSAGSRSPGAPAPSATSAS